jgi:ribose-phosphate pyrophosphokinase
MAGCKTCLQREIMGPFDELKVFTGNAHPQLAKDICKYLDIPLGNAEVFKFSNDNTFVRIQENVRQRDVFIVQPTSIPVNDNLMELLIMIDAAKRASAGRVTAVVPYYGYGRTDKKDQPRVPITARLVADLLTAAGADRLLTIDLHAGQIQGFFNIPVDELTALTILQRYFRDKNLDNLVVVAVDIGISKRARDLAERLQVPLAIIEKRRVGNNDKAELLNIIGDVEGMTALTLDDEVDTGGSLLSAASALREQGGVKEVYACVTHPVLSGKSANRIVGGPLEELVVTDTIPLPEEKRNGTITVLSVAPLIGEAIRRIHEGLSIGEMFE